MILYALSCEGGYVKKNKNKGCLCVPIEKASVVAPTNLEDLDSLAVQARISGLTNIFLVELKISEERRVEKY